MIAQQQSPGLALTESDEDADNTPRTMSAETRLARLDALLHAIFSTIHSDSRARDPGNVDAIGWLTTIAEGEVRHLQRGLTKGRAMDVDCGH